MLTFRELQLSDKPWVDELLSYSDFKGCEYTFGNNYVWKDIYDITVCRYNDFYIVKNKNGFMFPAGKGNIVELIDVLKQDCAERGEHLFFNTASKRSADLMKELFAEEVLITPRRDYFDYIYNYCDLATLVGKKYHSKRNFINRFSEYNWSYEAVDENNISDCHKMMDEWYVENDCENDADKKDEASIVRLSLDNFAALDYTGGLLRVDGKCVAFTFGEKRTDDCFVVHVEKALRQYNGAYPMINKEFICHLSSEFLYINREEDTGSENLRKAKLSYHPAFMEEKFSIDFI